MFAFALVLALAIPRSVVADGIVTRFVALTTVPVATLPGPGVRVIWFFPQQRGEGAAQRQPSHESEEPTSGTALRYLDGDAIEAICIHRGVA
jgi:hypothetical protein